MKKIMFAKMSGAGNDFVVTDSKIPGNPALLAKKICDRKSGIGADGLLLLGRMKNGDIRMRIFNADGSEAEMCGNGARCAAFFSKRKSLRLHTPAGIIAARVSGGRVKIKLTDPRGLRMDIPLKLGIRRIKVNFIDTGVPHAVIFVNGIEGIDVKGIGSQVRNHKEFFPRGANVNFVEEEGAGMIRVRTYERGVEDETLACGTGSTASALVFASKKGISGLVKVKTQSGEILRVYFKDEGGSFTDVWLEGGARIVYKGEYYV
ncbi:MAG: diaminopimelate epimerase [Candidatus Omnitrophica bacterium]|jgi:diaminopimelate epimerase|nr:diaminopimelate epimerase [Candidatus Omnitrophota bacterium]